MCVKFSLCGGSLRHLCFGQLHSPHLMDKQSTLVVIFKQYIVSYLITNTNYKWSFFSATWLMLEKNFMTDASSHSQHSPT